MIPKLLPYQRRWVQDESPIKVCEKARRIGLSWAEAYDSVLHAAADAGADVYYQSYSKDNTRGFIRDCAYWAGEMKEAFDLLEEPLLDGEPETYRMTFASGKAIVAMTSSPRSFRSAGRPGDRAILDEAAFMDDLEEGLKAALAFRVWGGRVRVISTHNGEASPFNGLVRDIRDGARPGSLHSTPLRPALEDGLFRRICKVRGQEWSERAEAEWEADLRREYGGGAAEELDCIPAAGGGAWLPWESIRRCEHVDAGKPDLAGAGAVTLGVDVARRGDLWVLAAVERVGDVLWTRDLVVRRGISFAEQRALVANAVEAHNPRRVAVDQTGMGEAFVEQLAERHGRLISGVLLTAPRRLDVATALREAVEDARLRIPRDEALRADLHSVRREATAGAAAPRLVAQGNTDGHADRFWALSLAVDAARTPGGPVEFAAGEPRASMAVVDGWDEWQ